MLQAAGFVKTNIVKDSPFTDSTIDFASMIRDLGFPIDKKPEELAEIHAAFKDSISSITVTAVKEDTSRKNT